MKPAKKSFLDVALGKAMSSIVPFNDITVAFGVDYRQQWERIAYSAQARHRYLRQYIEVTLIKTYASERRYWPISKCVSQREFVRAISELRERLLREAPRDLPSMPRAGASRIKKSPRNKRKRARRFS